MRTRSWRTHNFFLRPFFSLFRCVFFKYSSAPIQKNHFNRNEFKKMYIIIYKYTIYICFETIYLSYNIHWWLFSFTPQRPSFKVCHIHLWEELLKLMACHLDNLASNYPGRDLVTWYTWQRLGDLMVDEEN